MSVFNSETLENVTHDSSLFERTGRIQVENFLDDDFCALLLGVIKALDWRLVLNDGIRHIDLPREYQQRLGAKKLRKIKEEARARAKVEFQYLFENYPIYDLLQNDKAVPAPVKTLYTALNSDQMKDYIAGLTGKAYEFADMQATRYRARHFLTAHDDGIAGKNRVLAYVLNLSTQWKHQWGGLLEFLDETGDVIDNFQPGYNRLSIFSVPAEHRVSEVTTRADGPRLSITGWLRTN